MPPVWVPFISLHLSAYGQRPGVYHGQRKLSHHGYLDDFGGCHPSYHQALKVYNRFIQLAAELGLELANNKCTPPSTSIDWLEYHVDSNTMSVIIPPDKLQDIVQECGQWLRKDKASKKMIQTIVGKLIFNSNCVYPGRKFLARILRTLSFMPDNASTTLSVQFKADVKWFYYNTKIANGIFLCPPPPVRPTIEIECDSSLNGGGGNTEGFYYVWPYNPAHITEYPQIFQLEAINIPSPQYVTCKRHCVD